jgi:hypothetical protein
LNECKKKICVFEEVKIPVIDLETKEKVTMSNEKHSPTLSNNRPASANPVEHRKKLSINSIDEKQHIDMQTVQLGLNNLPTIIVSGRAQDKSGNYLENQEFIDTWMLKTRKGNKEYHIKLFKR